MLEDTTNQEVANTENETSVLIPSKLTFMLGTKDRKLHGKSHAKKTRSTSDPMEITHALQLEL